ncbi:MAG: hypothetical protein JNK23_07775 [Opitutaceae bacterium]|nr:hypothetical protein [Opitutaceae bacterium]
MSQPSAAVRTLPDPQGLLARAWANPDVRSVAIGVAAVLVFHLLLWLVGPRLITAGPVRTVAAAPNTARDFNIEFAPEQFEKPAPPPPPQKFVETNPEAPENTPDKTNNFAAQNQQVAQQKPTPDGKSDRPATEGKADHESNQIVSGRLSEPIEQVAQPLPSPDRMAEAEHEVKTARAEQNPLSGVEKFEGENTAGIGGNLAKRLPDAKPIPDKIDGAPQATQTEGLATPQPAIDPLRPRPRPQIVKQQQVRPAILAENKFGTQNVGLTAIDARWSNYGAYLQRVIDTVQIQWERLILSMIAMPAGGSTVSVKFVMDDDGKITEIRNVEASSTASETAVRACISAIKDRSPYGPWTDDMKAVLGTQQEMTFTFHYQ